MKAFHRILQALVTGCCILILSACGGGDDDVEVRTGLPAVDTQVGSAFVATLSAPDAVRQSSVSPTGITTFSVNPNTREVVAVARLSGTTPTSVVIRSPGVTQPIILALAETPPASGVWSATATLSEDQAAALRTGDLFVETASAAFPAGELTGSIVPQRSVSIQALAPGVGGTAATDREPVTLAAVLASGSVVPAVTSVAQGAAAAIVDPDTRVLEVALNISGTVPTSVVVGRGAAGSNGDAIFALGETVASSGVWFGRAVLTPDDLNALLAGGLYVQVISAAFPAGELRGQLLPQQRDAAFTENPALPDATDSTTPGSAMSLTPGTAIPDLNTSVDTSGTGTDSLDGSTGSIGTGFGSTGFGTGFGTSSIGTSGIGTSGIGTTGIGTSGIGTTGIGTTGIGTTGIGTDGTGADTSGITIPGSSLSTAPGGIGTGTVTNTPGSVSLGTTPGSISLGSTSSSTTTSLTGLSTGSNFGSTVNANPMFNTTGALEGGATGF